ncbi:hypothetical protein RRG08_038667 [Elysia crispata]|uniref:Amiloride-sensitive sodium channel n=1 Tax=Elysia crispata TaxID=231223 RepID=A0AAE0ZIN6_9GAST|nr:hypothetical protein RRG08_038667 [Elysia crispata]
MVVFGNALFPTQVRKKKMSKASTRLSGYEHTATADYGTLHSCHGSYPETLPVSQRDAGSQTDPRLLEPLSGEQRYDQAGSLTADINDIIYSFRSVTTIHGVQHAAAARNRSFRRRLWAILVSMMAIFLTWFLFQQVTALCAHQISTTTTFDLRETMEFPAVTMCNLNQYNKNRVPDNLTIQTVIFYMSEYSRVARELDPDFAEPDMSKVKDVLGEELLEIAARAAPTMKEFLVQCRWKGVLYNCSDLFHLSHTPQGWCYTFDMLLNQPIQTARVGEWAGLEVMLNIQQQDSYYSEELQAGIKVVVHRSGDNPFPKRYGWHVRPGVFASVALTQHNVSRTCLYSHAKFASVALTQHNVSRTCLYSHAKFASVALTQHNVSRTCLYSYAKFASVALTQHNVSRTCLYSHAKFASVALTQHNVSRTCLYSHAKFASVAPTQHNVSRRCLYIHAKFASVALTQDNVSRACLYSHAKFASVALTQHNVSRTCLYSRAKFASVTLTQHNVSRTCLYSHAKFASVAPIQHNVSRRCLYSHAKFASVALTQHNVSRACLYSHAKFASVAPTQHNVSRTCLYSHAKFASVAPTQHNVSRTCLYSHAKFASVALTQHNGRRTCLYSHAK